MYFDIFRRWALGLVLGLAAPALHAEKWTTLEGCELEKGEYADGDSFHVRSGTKKLIVRLYFVDAPETSDRFPDRVKAQAAHFGVSPAEVLKLGERAAAFTRTALAKRFTVVTRYEDARGDSAEPRYHAFVLPDGGKGDLGELLVENGLGRAYGATAVRPGGLEEKAEWQRLDSLEAKAKGHRYGAWGGKAPVAKGGDTRSALDDFFGQAGLAKSPTPKPLPVAAGTPTPSPRAASTPPPPAQPNPALLDLNTATLEQLETLPKIGKVLAGRIIAERPYRTVEELRKVPGIKDATLAAVAPFVQVRTP